MKTMHDFITRHKLQPGDAVVTDKSFFEIDDPYVIYLGQQGRGAGSQHLFLAKRHGEVGFLDWMEIRQLSKRLPERINSLAVTKEKRQKLVQFARERQDLQAYSLLLSHSADYNPSQKQKSSSSSGGPSTGAIIGGILGIAALAALGAWLIHETSKDDDE